jgi:NAD(P)-dependent dehydrogenase (short-subunit alcohol dehydrogenase family)
MPRPTSRAGSARVATDVRASDPVPVPGRFAGRVVLVTGAASGIGRATVLRFAAEGASVGVADIDVGGARGVAREAGESAEPLDLDQADQESIAAALPGWRAAANGLDVAVVNAGAVILPLTPLAETDPVEWDRVHGVNLRGAWLVARAVVPLLRARGGGAIVFTGSISGLRGHPGSGAYAASKAGVLGLSRSLAVEVARDGIRVNAVCPGAVATPLGGTADELEPFARLNPLGRVAQAEDIAAAICFLASNDARHITGAELVIDGGISMKAVLP